MEKVWQTTKQKKTYGESVADDKITEKYGESVGDNKNNRKIWNKCGR